MVHFGRVAGATEANPLSDRPLSLSKSILAGFIFLFVQHLGLSVTKTMEFKFFQVTIALNLFICQYYGLAAPREANNFNGQGDQFMPKRISILVVGLLGLQTVLLGVLAFRLDGLHRLLLDLQVGISSLLAVGSLGGKSVAVFLDVEPGDGPTKGSPDAPVTIVEFSDFTCRACADLQPTLRRILEEHDADVRLAFRYFPLSFQGKPFLLAKAAECGNQQGVFWALHDRLFARSPEIEGKEGLLEEVADLELDLDSFTRCLASEEVAARLRADFEAGLSYGVNSTPALFINGRRVLGTDIEYLRHAILTSQ